MIERAVESMPGMEIGDGKYKVLRRLAVGGMAEIYLAEAASIHGFRKKVVIKRILPQFAAQQMYVDMFLDEARLAARLNHASIVQVFDIGEDSEGVFFTMEYVAGRDLAEILSACFQQRRTLSFEEILAVLLPTAEALHHAHELRDNQGSLCNLIHRDVSPSNLLITNEGRVKLLDFGVAKFNDQQRETTGASLKGKFGYMAPEQIHGLALDRRADVFSFGVVLWELCTGMRLYPGGNNPPVLMKITGEDAPRPSTRRSEVPELLDNVCLKALARDPDQRYSSLQEVLHDLDAFAKNCSLVTNSRTLSQLLKEVFEPTRETKKESSSIHQAGIGQVDSGAGVLVQESEPSAGLLSTPTPANEDVTYSRKSAFGAGPPAQECGTGNGNGNGTIDNGRSQSGDIVRGSSQFAVQYQVETPNLAEEGLQLASSTRLVPSAVSSSVPRKRNKRALILVVSGLALASAVIIALALIGKSTPDPSESQRLRPSKFVEPENPLAADVVPVLREASNAASQPVFPKGQPAAGRSVVEPGRGSRDTDHRGTDPGSAFSDWSRGTKHARPRRRAKRKHSRAKSNQRKGVGAGQQAQRQQETAN